MTTKQILIGINVLAVIVAIAVLSYTVNAARNDRKMNCQYSDIFLISSDGDIDTMPGMYTFQDMGDSLVVEDAGENFVTFYRGADGTYIYEDVVYALAMGDEEISLISLGHDLRVALVGKSCE